MTISTLLCPDGKYKHNKHTKNNQQLIHITHSCTHCTPDAIMQAHFYTPAQSSSTQLSQRES